MTSSLKKKASAFEKRVRRQVTGRTHEFFVTTAPGLEPLCLDEIKALFPESPQLRTTTGGIIFNGRLHDLYQANLHLRTATRILMRLGTIRASTFFGLEKQLADFPWELYLPAGSRPEIRVTVHHCRLYHSDAVAERVEKAAAERLSAQGPDPASVGKTPHLQTIFVRGVADELTLSLDSSGPPLYQRGLKTHGGRAPLRETLAAAILMQAGYTGDVPLVDPMCGTGTFSLEGAMMAQHLPAGWFREFAFMDWPGFQEGRWRHLRRQVEENRQPKTAPPILAADTDADACQKLSQSLETAGLAGVVEVACTDFFSLTPTGRFDKPGLIVLNPPYGRRIEAAGGDENLFGRICDHLAREWAGWRVGLLAPDPTFVRHAPGNLAAIPLEHGGLKLTLLTGTLLPVP
ncbi:MAG: RNA methyltransferase [Desulfobacterales bacterium]|nr:RNA methyltransferase [Desulfobacterales bacterium]